MAWLYLLVLGGTLLLLRWAALRVLLFTRRHWRALLLRLTGSAPWVRSRPFRNFLQQRYPRTYDVLRRRLQPHPFTALPLTLLAAGTLYLLLLMAGLIDELLEAEEVVRADLWFQKALQPYRSEQLVTFFAWVTDFGDWPVLVAVSIVASGFLWADRRTMDVIPLWVTVLGAMAMTWVGKYGFDRQRPEFVTDVVAASPSFPSGHAAGAMAVYGFIAYAIARELPRMRDRFEVAYWALVLILLVGFSRTFLGVHYLSDVAMGILVGAFWLLVGLTLSEYTRAVPPGEHQTDR